MNALHLDADEYATWLESPFVDEEIAGDPGISLVVIRSGRGGPDPVLPAPGSLPIVVAWTGDHFGAPGPVGADVVVGPDEVDLLITAVQRAPRAAVALAVLLRAQATLDVEAGLATESALYSMLQAGPEFAAWRAAHAPAPLPAEHDVVAASRNGGELAITLDRPNRHNAITAQLRDELAAALAVARVDDTITDVVLRGNGPSFCSGGDLDEFGIRPDPATAHVTRLARSPARLIHRLGNVTARIHGTTVGGGIEMAAFAHRVVADPETTLALPEIALGLIPGAGGTVSLTRRIGRQRTAALGLTGRTIAASTALDWGLVDAIEPIS